MWSRQERRRIDIRDLRRRRGGPGAPPAAPANTAPPVISGTAQQGQTLTASKGTWTNSPSSYGYQWQDCTSRSCTNISGATSSTYTLQASDVGDTIDVVVTATNAGGSSSASSGQTAAVTSSGSSVPPGELTCNLNATTSNFTTQIADATPGRGGVLGVGRLQQLYGYEQIVAGNHDHCCAGGDSHFQSGDQLNL